MKKPIGKLPLAGVCVIALAACTDLEPIRAQVNDLQSQLIKLQTDNAKATAAATKAANAASLAANGAQNSLTQLKSATQANALAIAALDEKIDRMFKRPSAKKTTDTD
jgi:hypothetical protein